MIGNQRKSRLREFGGMAAITVLVSAAVVIMFGLSFLIITPTVNVLDLNSVENKQDEYVTQLSGSPIVKTERYHDGWLSWNQHSYGLSLTLHGQVYELGNDYVCQLDVPPSINIYCDRDNRLILTNDLNIISIGSVDIDVALSFFSGRDVKSIQLAGMIDHCELVMIGEPMYIHPPDPFFVPEIIEF